MWFLSRRATRRGLYTITFCFFGSFTRCNEPHLLVPPAHVGGTSTPYRRLNKFDLYTSAVGTVARHPTHPCTQPRNLFQRCAFWNFPSPATSLPPYLSHTDGATWVILLPRKWSWVPSASGQDTVRASGQDTFGLAASLDIRSRSWKFRTTSNVYQS